ncbi:MAG: transposase [bacterium]
MSKLLRYFAPGQSCFITAVTARRQPVLDQHAELLLRAVRRAVRQSRFALIAWVVLPDHLHAIIDSPDGDISRIVQRVRLSFSLQWQRRSRRNGPIWQPRYWDHIIRSEKDMKRHVDYVHYNPVRHGLMDSPRKWRLSSFRRFQRAGVYNADWGENQITVGDDEFGE